MDNYIDYLLVNWYVQNTDWPHRNYYMARRRGPDSTGFKFFVWDAEFTLGAGLPTKLDPAQFGDPSIPGPGQLYPALYTSEEFRVRMRDRVQQHFAPGGAFYVSPDQPQWDADAPHQNVPAARYAQIVDQVRGAVVAESARWSDSLTALRRSVQGLPTTARQPIFTRDDPWLRNVAYDLNRYFPQRSAELLRELTGADLYAEAPRFLLPPGHVTPGSPLRIDSIDAKVYVTFDGSDPRLPGGRVSDSAIECPLTRDRLIARGSQWRFVDTIFGPPRNWPAPDFDDSNWPAGRTEIGTGDGDEVTPLFRFGVTLGYTSYFRKEFTVSDPSEYESLLLRLKRDDGAIVYVNGQEVVRSNMTAGPASLSRPLYPVTGSGEDAFQAIRIDAALLRPGRNVIAVEVHDYEGDLLFDFFRQRDTSFDLELLGIPATGAAGIVLPPSADVVARGFNDGRWGPRVLATYFSDSPADASNLVVTEVNYHPRGPNARRGEPPVDGEAFEFIEVQNVSPAPINLDGARFVDGVEFTFGNLALPPGQRAVVVRDRTAFRDRYGSSDILVAGQFARGGLSNGGERIELISAAGEPIAAFTYDDSGRWPAGADGAGYSLQLIGVDGGYNDPTNWRASRRLDGSPGRGDGGGGLDGPINAVDLLSRLAIVHALQGGKYLTGERASFAEGDFNGDGTFDQLDIVVGLAEGGIPHEA